MRVYKNFPDDEKLRAAIVIPSYDEADGILPTVHAWIMQAISSGVRAALFVVVNNSKNSSDEVKDSNYLTHELMKALVEGGVDPRRYEESSWSEFTDLRNLIEHVQFRLALVDLWSKGNAPKKCNVGVARDVGARVACDYLEENGFLVMTDADTIPLRRYLSHANRILQVPPKVAALKGVVYVENRYAPEESEKMFMKDCLQDLQVIMQRAARIYFLGKTDRGPFPHLPGSNTVVTKEAYLAVGGIPHINGAEDTELSRKILRAGHTIREVGDFLEVQTSSRVSLRTDRGHGLGQIMKEASDYQQAPWKAPVLSFDACLFLERLLDAIEYVNGLNLPEKNDWKEALETRMWHLGAEALEDVELERLWSANQGDPTLKEIHFNRVLLIEADRIAEEIYGTVPFYTAWKDFTSSLRSLECGSNESHALRKTDIAHLVSTPRNFLVQVSSDIRSIHRFLKKKAQQLSSKPLEPVVKPDLQEAPSEPERYDPYFQWMIALYVFFQNLLKKDLTKVH